MADAGAIKNMNVDAVRCALREGGAMSKSALARQTELSFPTISRTVDELLERGELQESGIEESTGGRCAKIFSINPLFAVSCMLHIEEGDLVWFVCDLSGERAAQGSEAYEAGSALPALQALLDRILSDFPQLGSIAVGLSGIVSGGTVLAAFDCEALNGVSLCTVLGERYSLPVAVENERNLAAAGFFSRTQSAFPSASLVCIHMGKNGIGAGLVLGGSIWHGLFDFAGELSFLPAAQNDAAAFSSLDALVDYYASIIQSYAALLGPNRVVIYDSPQLEESPSLLQERCAALLPEPAIPKIEYSSEFLSDYERGLWAVSHGLLTGWPVN